MVKHCVERLTVQPSTQEPDPMWGIPAGGTVIAMIGRIPCFAAAIALLAAAPGWCRDPVARFGSVPLADLFEVASGEIAQVRSEGGAAVYEWVIHGGQTSTLDLADACPFKSRLRYFDRLLFDYQIAEGQVSSLDVSAFGHVPGPRQGKVHEWGLAMITTPARRWRTVRIDLDQPNWFPWDNKDGQPTDTFLRFPAGIATRSSTRRTDLPSCESACQTTRSCVRRLGTTSGWQTPIGF
jgi:hypothetical protein